VSEVEIPEDVQDRAAQLAHEAYICAYRPTGQHSDRWHAVVDAVVAVVAPEIERPLQARIEELEGEVGRVQEVFDHNVQLRSRTTELEKTLSDNRKMWDESIAQTGAALELHDAAQARVTEQYPHDGLSCAEVEQEVTRLAEENRVLKARIAELEAAAAKLVALRYDGGMGKVLALDALEEVLAKGAKS
jgi:hypothetical protein